MGQKWQKNTVCKAKWQVGWYGSAVAHVNLTPIHN